ERELILEEYPYWTTIDVTSDTYEHLEDDITNIAFWNMAVASADLSDDVVYEIVKATFENHDQLLSVDPAAQDTLAENISHSTVPLHPGAYRYYEEEGIDVPQDLIPEESNQS